MQKRQFQSKKKRPKKASILNKVKLEGLKMKIKQLKKNLNLLNHLVTI
jgi:hypothetical protein